MTKLRQNDTDLVPFSSKNLRDNKMKKIITTFALLFFLPTTALYAEESLDLSKLKACTSIKDDKKRLACFDESMRTKLSLKAEKSIAKVKSAEVKEKPSKTIVISTEEAFGKKEAEINQMESLKSNIVGQFKGWKKGTTITLANGQKWKVLSRTTGYVNLVDPAVEIERAVFGSFKMKVEGLNSSARVKRIK